jgi:general secretion pathway protein K
MKRNKLKKKLRARKQKRGIAIIMVLGALSVMTVMLAELQFDTSAYVAAAMADRDSVQAEYMARSAINLSRLLIATEPTIRQSIAPLFMMLKRAPPQLPVWEFAEKLLAAFNDKEAAAGYGATVGLNMDQGKNLGMPGGRFELQIVDEDSKINANLGAANDIAHIRLAKELMGLMAPLQYSPLFEQRDQTGQFHDRQTICSALIDWSDVDEQFFSCDLSTSSQAPTGSAVEDAYYQLLDKPYRRKNAPYDSLEELHMVRGITDDYWATFVDPDPTRPDKRVMTVWGQGAINVNSANAQTLLGVVCSGAPQADVCIDPAQASMFLMGVTMARGITMGAPLFGSPAEFIATMKGQGQLGPLLAKMGMKPVKFLSETEFAKSITTESKVFSIYAVGVVKGYKRETRVKITTVVDFRGAPAIGAPVGQTPAAGTSTSAGLPPSSSSTNNGIGAVLQPNPSGAVVYYRID